MSMRTPFGRMTLEVTKDIERRGGINTIEGREDILLETLSLYMALEAMNGSMVVDTMTVLFRTLARTIVHYSALLATEKDGDYDAVPEIAGDLMEFLDDSLDVALEEFEVMRTTGGIDIIHIGARR